jgi:hypothetical protein
MNDPRNAGDRSPKTLEPTVVSGSRHEQPRTLIGPDKLPERIDAGVFGIVLVAGQQQPVWEPSLPFCRSGTNSRS